MDLPLPGDAVRTAVVFGKLPAHGDFVARGLSAAEAAGLDDYLSASLGDAAMLEDFDALYATAPAWRFVIELDGRPVCGVIAPSVDKVGRQFPVMAGVAASSGSLGLLADACEAHLYQTFADGGTADDLAAALAAFPEDPDAPGLPPAGWFLEDENKVIVDRLDGNRPLDLVTRMMESARLRS